MREWLELLRRLGDAVLELAGAEVDALAEDLRHGGRQAARALLLAAVAFVLAALAWSLFTLALVWGLATLIGPWQAALAVGAVYALVAAAFATAARRRWRATEPPLDMVKRRWRQQNDWFRERILTLPASEQETGDDR
jgi:membrane protein